MARSEWRVEVDGKQVTAFGGQLHVAVKRALVGYPLPPMGQTVVIRVWRVKTVPPRRRR